MKISLRSFWFARRILLDQIERTCFGSLESDKKKHCFDGAYGICSKCFEYWDPTIPGAEKNPSPCTSSCKREKDSHVEKVAKLVTMLPVDPEVDKQVEIAAEKLSAKKTFRKLDNEENE